MASPWEQKWNEMKQGVEEVVGNASETLQNSLPWARDWKAKATPQQAPAAPPEAPKALTVDDIMPRLIQAESRGVHMDEKGVLTTSPVGAQGITQLMPSTAAKPGYGIAPVKDKSEAEYLRVGKAYLQKMYEKFGDWEKALAAYNAGVGNVMKAEGKAERFGGDWKDFLPKKDETLPYIKKIMKPEDMKPISSLKGQQLAATDVKMPRALEAAGEFAQAAGEGVQDAALAAGAGVTGSSVAAVLAENVADPLNLIPAGKAAAIGMIGKEMFEGALQKLKKYITPEALDELSSAPSYKARDRLVLMKPQEFLDAAEEGFDERKMKGVAERFAKGDKLPADNLPQILINSDGKMWGHEGRHRARQFMKEGVELIPVRIKSGNIRFSEQGGKGFDDLGDRYPEMFITERGATKPFPVPRSEANLPNAGVGAESAVVNSSFIPSKYIKTPYDPKTGYSSELNNPIHLGADAPPGLAGARLSGFTDPNNKYFHGYDKNGEKFTIEASRVNPDWITASKDGNKTAEYFRERLKGK